MPGLWITVAVAVTRFCSSASDTYRASHNERQRHGRPDGRHLRGATGVGGSAHLSAKPALPRKEARAFEVCGGR